MVENKAPLRFLLLAAALCTSALMADGHGDLRSALFRPRTSDPLKAAAEYQFWQDTGSEKQPKVLQGCIQALVEDGPQGLRILWPSLVLEQARQEARLQSQNPEAPDPVRTALRELDVLQVQANLDASEALLRDLEQAKLLEERVDAWKGHSARRLSYRLEPKLPEETRKALKKLEATMTVWIASDGTPLASSTSVHFKASKMLIGIESTRKEEKAFALRGSRLVVLHHTQEETTSAMGDHSRTRRILDLAFN